MRGRPLDPDKQKQQKHKLVVTARALMSEKSYKNITIREIASASGLNSAMIRYYFESKEGLFLAVMKSMASESLEQVAKVTQSDKPIKAFIETMLSIINQDQALARLIHDEILNYDSPLREELIASFPARVAQFLPKLIEQEIKQRDSAVEINFKYAAFNLMSMIMLPFIAAPIRKDAWLISDEEITSSAWVEHVYQQFIYGCLRERN